jgi:transposase
MSRIGESVHEALDIVPAILRVLRTIRPKYACRACESAMVQAPAPPRPFDAGMASTALVAWVVASKFAWHLPLHRQTQMLGGYGVTLDRSTLVHWVDRAAWWLQGVYDRLLTHIHGAGRVYCDETPLPVLEKGRRRTRKCQFWAHGSDDRPWNGPAPPAVAYVFAHGRGTGAILDQIGTRFTGVLQVDGYGAYKALVKRTAPAASGWRFVWRTRAGNSSRCTRPRPRRRHSTSSSGSPPSTPSRRPFAAGAPNTANQCGPAPLRR